MLVNMNKMLLKAYKEKYCVPHFNINNLEWTKFILEASESVRSPIILGVSEGAIKYFGGYHVVVNVVKSLIRDLSITVDVALHLDHGTSYESCKKAIDAGFTSVMIDASKYSLEDNIYLTKKVVNYAHPFNVTVEGEIGHIGGVEDGVINEILYTNVKEAKMFYENTNIDFLAPALGSVHGLYNGEPKLAMDRMLQISQELQIPLVLHGGTGISDELIKKAISCGINKLNINTELQIIWTNEVRKFLDNDVKVYDPRKIIKSGELALKNAVINKIEILGSKNKA
ncbi:MAG: class II fructose-1,6-bisphosphate aldolase [Bacilli bacterium]